MWKPERLAYWYFRLNGFLTTENFVVHPDTGTNVRTDADLLAIRFRERSETLVTVMEDDARVSACAENVNAIIAEIKTGPCALNGPWTNRAGGNIRRVLLAIGCIPEAALDSACEDLYRIGRWTGNETSVRLFACGQERADLLVPVKQQLVWDEMIGFLVGRFSEYKRQKSELSNWSDDGQELRRLALGKDPVHRIRKAFNLPTS